jgi:DNA-binding NtrC family response regulator
MKACVVYVDQNKFCSNGCEKTLEEAGCLVLSARHEARAVELLGARHVDVVCIAATGGDVDGQVLGSSIKRSKPDVPIVLIRDAGAAPADFEQFADVVIDELDFAAAAPWLIEKLHDKKDLFFVRWFVDWMSHPSQLQHEASIPDC